MDNLTKGGAAALAERIVSHWRGQGYQHVRAVVVQMGRLQQDGKRSYAVRTNLVAGLPPLRPTPVKADDRKAA